MRKTQPALQHRAVKLSQISLDWRWAANGFFLASFAILTNSRGVPSCMCMDEHIYTNDVHEVSTMYKSFCSLLLLLKCMHRCCRLLRPLSAQHLDVVTASLAFTSVKYIQIFALWQEWEQAETAVK